MDEFYYGYLGLRRGNNVEDLRITGIGNMDQSYVGAIPFINELEVVEEIEKDIFKLRLTSMTICKIEL